jgi:hypothetical protein
MLNKADILSKFPNVKLSYENITHKKVYNSNYIVAIPVGRKCFIWFTTINGKSVCLLMELSQNKQVEEIKMTNTRFSHDLSIEDGTIIYGTKFYYSNMNFFSIEDIFSYKGRTIYNSNWQDKLSYIKDLLENDIYQKSYNSYLTFGLPIMCNRMDEFEVTVANVGYKIDSVQFYLYNRINSYLVMDYRKFTYKKLDNNNNNSNSNNNSNNISNNLMMQFGLVQSKPNEPLSIKNSDGIKNSDSIKNSDGIKKQFKKESTFIVRPDIQSDIYNLFNFNTSLDKEEFIGFAHIPDFKTSVMMNNLFRIIKENKNLDALEESDDEEEFENENEDKFVHLDKEYKMVCEYSPKFKKWIPIRVFCN